MNQIQSIRVLSAGLINLSVALIRPVQRSGANRLPQNSEKRDGSIGSNTANSRPTSTEINPWLIKATTKPPLLKAVNCVRSARAKEGMAAAARRLMGYQMLR